MSQPDSGGGRHDFLARLRRLTTASATSPPRCAAGAGGDGAAVGRDVLAHLATGTFVTKAENGPMAYKSHAINPGDNRWSSAIMADVEEVEVVAAHNERATLRVGDVFLKTDA